jgi:L-asparaginase
MQIILANSEGGVGMPPAVSALRAGQPALDILEAGIRPVELDPTVRSVGVGGWPNLLGDMELDASIMDGATLKVGAVGALRGFLHPITVARLVMEKLPHVFLVGEGAGRFAAEHGLEAGEILTEQSREEWASWLVKHIPPEIWERWPNVPLTPWVRLTVEPQTAHGTTTFLVKDTHNNIAAGVSTCGWAWKYPGRLGDSPVIGAGSYADNRYGAAACTGTGEFAIRAGTARAVVLYMKMGMTVEEACHEAARDLSALKRDSPGWVTIHALNAEGQPYVLSAGQDGDLDYWLWHEGMAAPERRRAEAAPLT